jgi:hypothetical protein
MMYLRRKSKKEGLPLGVWLLLTALVLSIGIISFITFITMKEQSHETPERVEFLNYMGKMWDSFSDEGYLESVVKDSKKLLPTRKIRRIKMDIEVEVDFYGKGKHRWDGDISYLQE